jgi:hypothetical protein
MKFIMRQYKERPLYRKAILRLLEENPELTLEKIAYWYKLEDSNRCFTDGFRLQALKMLQEEGLNECHVCFKTEEISTQTD